MQEQQQKFSEKVRKLQTVTQSLLPQVVEDIMNTLSSYAEDQNLLPLFLLQMSKIIMSFRNTKNYFLPKYETLISQVIKISAKNEFKLGTEAVRIIFDDRCLFYQKGYPSSSPPTWPLYLKFLQTFVEQGGLTKTLKHLRARQNEPIVLPLLYILGMIAKYSTKAQIDKLKMSEIYKQLIIYLQNKAETFGVKTIGIISSCIDYIGPRLTISEIQDDKNELRKRLIKIFLKLTFEKKGLAMDYLSQLINPTIPTTQKSIIQLYNFLKNQSIFQLVYNTDMHEHCLSRSGFLLSFMIKFDIATKEKLQSLWNLHPHDNLIKRNAIQQILTENLSCLPLNFVEFIVEDFCALHQTQLTISSLNFLRQLRNTKIANDVKMKVVLFLWKIIKDKCDQIPQKIEEEVEKTFKYYVDVIVDHQVRMNLLQDMIIRLRNCKVVKNQIKCLKDFIKTYPSPLQSEMDESTQTTLGVVNFIKGEGIYGILESKLFNSKQVRVKREIFDFMTFLFDHGETDISSIIKRIYEGLGPLSEFLEWLNTISHKCSEFIEYFLEKTNDFDSFEDLKQPAYAAIQNLIIDANAKKDFLKLVTFTIVQNEQTNQNSRISPLTRYANVNVARKFNIGVKSIEPQAEKVNKHIQVRIHPYKLIGMQFLKKILYVAKSNQVCNAIIRLIFQIINSLDETIKANADNCLRLLFFDIAKEIRFIIDKNKYNEKALEKLKIYVKIIYKMFQETQKDGLIGYIPFFEKIKGQILTFKVKNLLRGQRGKILTLMRNQNSTFWNLKSACGMMIGSHPKDIDIIGITDADNGKRLVDLGFKGQPKIIIKKKQQKPVPENNNLNPKAYYQKFLPRKLLTSKQVYEFIFRLLNKPNFKQVHLCFYHFLYELEVYKVIDLKIENIIYQTIQKQQKIYVLAYSLDLLNVHLAKKSQFYLEFISKKGLTITQSRMVRLLKQKSLQNLEVFMRSQIIYSFMKIISIYASQFLLKYKIARFANKNKISEMSLQQLVRKIYSQESQIQQNSQIQLPVKADEILKLIYVTCHFVLDNMIDNFKGCAHDYMLKPLTELVRVLTSLVGSHQSYHSFCLFEYLPLIKTESIYLRQSVTNLIYIYLFHSEKGRYQQTEQAIQTLLKNLPTDNKFDTTQYFSLLKILIANFLQMNQDKESKDADFISIGQQLLDTLFEKVKGEAITSLIPDPTIQGILSIIDIITDKKTICISLSSRILQFTHKCLFANDIEEKIKQFIVTEEMLCNPIQSQYKNYVMCKTEVNRNLAYGIVAKMYVTSRDQKIKSSYFNSQILPMIETIKVERSQMFSKEIGVGLKNFGNTCYMNSMLQVLNSLKPFRNLIMKCQSQESIIKELKKMFAALFYSQRRQYRPQKIRDLCIKQNQREHQQDTNQFLTKLFDLVEISLRGGKYAKILDQIFKGSYCTQNQCLFCFSKKYTNSQFTSFAVDIQDKMDLYQALDFYKEIQIISDSYCDQCKKKVTIRRRNVLSWIPSVMFIHLKRFSVSYVNSEVKKINNMLQFPEQFNIQPYTKQGVELRETLGLKYMKSLAHNQDETKIFEEKAQHAKVKDFYKMKLKGVIVHRGDMDGGHYYTLLKEDNSWTKYDDQAVTSFNPNDFPKVCYGGTNLNGIEQTENAYVLIYEKVVKNPITIFNDNEMTDEPATIQYDDVKVYNTPQDYRQLWMDNHMHMLQKQLFGINLAEGFRQFVFKIINGLPTPCEKVSRVVNILYSNSYHIVMTEKLLQILKNNPQMIERAQPALYQNFLIKKKEKTRQLLYHNTPLVRELTATFMHIALIKAYKTHNMQKDVYGYINGLLNQLKSAHIKKQNVSGYFFLLLQIVQSSPALPNLWELIISKNMISTLIDYLIATKFPMISQTKKSSQISSIISIILFLLKHSYLLSNENHQIPPIPQNLLFHLNKSDVILLSSHDLYLKMIAYKQNLKELGMIMQKLSIGNLPFSQFICEILLTSINSQIDQTNFAKSPSLSDIHVLCSICLQILKIRDEYWQYRANILLGYARLASIDSLEEDRFQFQSTSKQPNTPLLSYVWSYRQQYPQLSLQLANTIIQGCSISDVSKKYLTRQPSANNLYPNFFSWLKDFVSKLTASKGNSNQSQRSVKDMQCMMRSIKDMEQFMNEQKDIDFYKPIISGKIQNRKLIHTYINNGIKVQLNECNALCLESNFNLTRENLIQSVYNPYNINYFAYNGIEEHMAEFQFQEEKTDLQRELSINYFRQLVIQNCSTVEKIVKIKFDPLKNRNMICPLQKCWRIKPKKRQKIQFAKQDPYKDWEQLKIELFVKNFVQAEKEWDERNRWLKIYGQRQNKMPINHKQQKQVMTPLFDSRIQQLQQINCPQCTFLNRVTSTICEMCQALL